MFKPFKNTIDIQGWNNCLAICSETLLIINKFTYNELFLALNSHKPPIYI